MSEEEKREFSPLSSYSSCLAFYQGKGVLTLSDQQTVPCIFEIGQLRKGNIFLFCKDLEPTFLYLCFASNGPSIKHFEGTTTEGFHLSSMGNIIVTGELSPNLTCLVQALSIDMMKDIQPHHIRFGLTNFFVQDIFSFHLDHEGVAIEIRVEPVEQYNNVIERVSLLKTIDVTCEVIGSLTDFINVEIFTKVVNNLCYLLSIAQGTKIQWLYQAFFDVTGECISRAHHSNVTKVYGSNEIIRGHLVRTFVERTYSSYVANRERYRFDIGTIDIYLDAKTENDYLQVRGVKLAVSMEVIKAIFIGLQPELKRKTFKKLLDHIFLHLQLNISEEETKRFVQGRNNLVHEGCFSCEVEARKNKVPPSHQEMVQEYFFLVSILDRVILKLLGYQGMFVDAQRFVDRKLD